MVTALEEALRPTHLSETKTTSDPTNAPSETLFSTGLNLQLIGRAFSAEEETQMAEGLVAEEVLMDLLGKEATLHTVVGQGQGVILVGEGVKEVCLVVGGCLRMRGHSVEGQEVMGVLEAGQGLKDSVGGLGTMRPSEEAGKAF